MCFHKAAVDFLFGILILPDDDGIVILPKDQIVSLLSLIHILELRMEVDTGMHRTGIPYDLAADEAEKIAALPGIRLQGIFTFRGMIIPRKVKMPCSRIPGRAAIFSASSAARS